MRWHTFSVVCCIVVVVDISFFFLLFFFLSSLYIVFLRSSFLSVISLYNRQFVWGIPCETVLVDETYNLVLQYLRATRMEHGTTLKRRWMNGLDIRIWRRTQSSKFIPTTIQRLSQNKKQTKKTKMTKRRKTASNGI